MNVRLRKIYAEALRRLRTLKGWSQTELGDQIGLTKAAVSKIETCKQSLTSKLIEDFLGCVGVELHVFHRLCEAIELELEVVSAEGRSRRTRQQHRPSPKMTLPLLRQSLGPVPGSDLRLNVEVSVERCSAVGDGRVTVEREI